MDAELLKQRIRAVIENGDSLEDFMRASRRRQLATLAGVLVLVACSAFNAVLLAVHFLNL